MNADGDPDVMRVRLTVRGIVQGVGFRPFVHRLAVQESLTGSVVNTSAGVVIEAQGPPPALGRFNRRLRDEAPPLASILDLTSVLVPTVVESGFAIGASRDQAGLTTAVPPDVALCADCRREVRDPGDRRFGYAFTNCTNCGPRWTLIDSLPYDRPRTSMARFAMCAACRSEYEDPADRRFHAQPNACADCGPRLWLCGPDGADREDQHPLAAAAAALAAGEIVAVRGLGGLHLAVRADDETAVARLRRRKHRVAKPLALMVADLAAARALAIVTPDEDAALASPAAPIVLLERREGAAVAPAVAPGHRRLGVMVASTPLHLLLFDETVALGLGALVMTSGNAADEPVCIGNEDALERLRGIADHWLLHDREILRRADDSVLQVVGGAPLLVRRSRGFAPAPVPVDVPGGGPVLAVGGDLKGAVCLLKDGWAFLSPHIGDLEDLRTRDFFTETVAGMSSLLDGSPVAIAHDRHPGYASANWARDEGRRRGLPAIGVQHHHAHLVAVQAEHRVQGSCVGLIMDGTGYGDDGTIWGGELLVGDATGFTRAGWFEPVPLPGGDAAVRAPWRTAIACLRHAGLLGPLQVSGDFDPAPALVRLAADWPALAARPAAMVLEMLARDINCPRTSSCGRLFDAVAALAGVRLEIAYEAQAAMELMALTDAAAVSAAAPLPGVLEDLRRRKSEPDTSAADGGALLLPTGAIIRGVAQRLRAGDSAAAISAAFHRTLIDVLAYAATRLGAGAGGLPVVLGGGVFLNELLTAGLVRRLEDDGMTVYRPRLAPPGDGGLALGQAVIAAHRLAANGIGD
jgi:hydrogenase maturation protein HypF